jgi:hypothetical protein
MKYLKIILPLVLIMNTSISQQRDDNYLSWSSVHKLTVNDFIIKTTYLQTSPSFAQFFLGFGINGFDAFTKNFNKKVHNYFIKSASWIDTTYNTATTLRYQQTLFDISEIYARRFRNELIENRKKIIYGTQRNEC